LFTKENEDFSEVTMRFKGGDEMSLKDIIITPDWLSRKIKG